MCIVKQEKKKDVSLIQASESSIKAADSFYQYLIISLALRSPLINNKKKLLETQN